MAGLAGVCVAALGLAACASPTTAQSEDGDGSALTESVSAAVPTPIRDEQALAVVGRMAERIAGAERLAMHGEIAWDVVQDDGRTLEFGATRALVLRRPDRLRVEISPRETGVRRLLYDGSQLVLEDLEHEVYAVVERSGPVDEVAAYAGDRLGVPIALAEFLSPHLPQLLTDEIDDARYVGASTIDGELCDHVSLRNEIGGLQLWISQKDSLPRRVAITYEHEDGRPQFRARFTGWNLSPDASDAVFRFTPPKGAERIVFAPLPAPPSPEEAP